MKFTSELRDRFIVFYKCFINKYKKIVMASLIRKKMSGFVGRYCRSNFTHTLAIFVGIRWLPK